MPISQLKYDSRSERVRWLENGEVTHLRLEIAIALALTLESAVSSMGARGYGLAAVVVMVASKETTTKGTFLIVYKGADGREQRKLSTTKGQARF